MRQIVIGCAALAGVMLSPSGASAQIVNGNFESGTTAPWVTEGAISSGIQALFAAPDGGAGAMFGFTQDNMVGRFSQTFNLAAGGAFDVAFFLGRGEVTSGSNDVALTFRALVDGQVIADQLPGAVGSVPFFTQFTPYAASVNLSAGSHVLAFEFSRGPSGFLRGPYFILDAVGVAPSAAPGVPEPANWALMIAGFGVAGAAARRRGRTLFA